MTSAPAARFRLFGQPHLLEGEDGAVYDELLARVCAAVKPVDIVDEIFIADVVSLQWEVLRWNRLKCSLIRAHGLARLEQFLGQDLDYDLCADHFANELAELLQTHLPRDQAEHAQTLAEKCAEEEPEAIESVKKILANM
jgi:hypothetical protein